MIHTVIGELYYSFSATELKQFDFYMSNSQWQFRETIVKCHLCFMEYTMQRNLENLTKEIIFQSIYFEEKHNDGKLRYTISKLTEAIKEFYIHIEFESENIFTQKVWSDIILSKRLRKNIQYSIENTKISQNSEYRMLNNYFKSQELNTFNFYYNKDVQVKYSSIFETMKSAELFSDLVFLKNYCSLISFSNVFQSDSFELPIDKLNEIKKKNWEKSSPEFLVYLHLIDLLIVNNDEAYYTYKTSIFNHFEIWDDEEKVNLVIYMLNYTSLQINKGNKLFIDEQYELFLSFEENGIFSLKNYINQGRINNVVFIYLRKKEFSKAEEFVKKYSPLLEPEYIDTCRHFNIARIKFENNLYKESLRELLQVDFTMDPFYSLNSKQLLMKNYFELNETDALQSLSLSFKEYIRRNKVISDTNKTNYLNFVKYIMKLYGATNMKKREINQKLEEMTQILDKIWLLEKSKT